MHNGIIGGLTILSLGSLLAVAAQPAFPARSEDEHASLGPERMVFVRDGEPLEVYGSAVRHMRREGNALLLRGPEHDGGEWGHTLLADAALHRGDFNIRARLTLEELDGSGVSFLMGGHYHNNRDPQAGRRTLRVSFDGEDGRLEHGFKCQRVIWDDVEKTNGFAGSSPLEAGKPFDFEWTQRGDAYTVTVNGEKVFESTSTPQLGEGGAASFGFIVPGAARMRLHDFSASGVFAKTSLECIDLWALGDGDYNMYRIPGLIVTPQGTLLAFAEGRDRRVNLVSRRSTDGGATWSEPIIVQKSYSMDPSPLVNWKTGEVLLLMRGTPRPAPISPHIMQTKDDGLSWTGHRAIELLPDTRRLMTPGPNSGIQIVQGEHKGRLVSAVYYILKDEAGGEQPCAFIYSDDGGETWKLGGSTPHHTYEPQVVELKDERVLLTCRDHNRAPDGRHASRRRGVAISNDGGETIDTYERHDALHAAGVDASIIRYVLPGKQADVEAWGPLVYCGPEGPGRNNLGVRLSYDEGETWSEPRLIYDGFSAYSAMAVLPDGRIGVIFERDNYRRLSFAAFTLDWAEQGGFL